MLEVTEYSLLSVRSTSYLVIEVGLKSKTSDSELGSVFSISHFSGLHVYSTLFFSTKSFSILISVKINKNKRL